MTSFNDNTPKVTIIILNWNSWRDTIECLESVLKIKYPDFNIILIDNNSTNHSAKKIINWLDGKSAEDIKTSFPHLVEPYVGKPITYSINKIIDGKLHIGGNKNHEKVKIIFLLSDNNLGFAVANNVAIRFGQDYLQSKYFYLLNNDTVVEPDVLSYLVDAMGNNSDIGVAQSTIYRYSNPLIIANAGAKIFPWAQTKYYKTIDRHEIKSVDFINGCAMFIRSSIINKYGALTETFFFGEEDFEYSLRLKKRGVRRVCISGSKVYHKIGVSSFQYVKNKQNKKLLIFMLNRIIDMRGFYPIGTWRIWRIFALIYFYLITVFKNKNTPAKALKFICRIYYLTNSINDVKKDTIEPILDTFSL